MSQRPPHRQPPAMAAAVASPEHRPSRAQTPTPIATGKGLRSAAVDDHALSEYLETSLKVPDLTLPGSYHLLRRRSPIDVIDLETIRSGDGASIRRLVASACEAGAFGVEGSGVSAEEVGSVIEMVSRRVFGTSDEANREGGRCFGRRRGVWNELCWYRPMRQEDESALEMLLSDAYPSLRKKLEDISLKLEAIANLIIQIISEQLKNLPRTKRTTNLQESLLRLRKYDPHHLGNWSSLDDSCKTMDHPSHALSLHISLKDQEFSIRSHVGSFSFLIPRGLIIVTIGKLLQEYSNDLLKSAIGQPVFVPSHGPDPFFTLEFVCFSKIPHSRQNRFYCLGKAYQRCLVLYTAAVAAAGFLLD